MAVNNNNNNNNNNRTPKNKSRTNTPRNNNNNNSTSNTKNKTNKYNNKAVTPKTKSRSQTPSNKHKSNNVNQNQTPTTTTTTTTTTAHTPHTPTLTPEQQLDQLSPATKQAFHDALEDVHTRFILNLPEEELASSDRLFFQMEQAWWFYEDFICDEMEEGDTMPSNNNNNNNNTTTTSNNNNTGSSSSTMNYANAVTKEVINYPRFTNLKPFAKHIFTISPILHHLLPQFDNLYKTFSYYRRKISTYGTILLNTSCTQLVLCQDYNGKSWTLPAGKVNQNEKGMDAAVRETYEETGFDINCNFGLTTQSAVSTTTIISDDDDNNSDDDNNNDKDNNTCPRTWSELTEENSLAYSENDGSGKRRTCYICHGVPTDFPFAPIVRKEVADVQWHDIDDIPKKSFAVLPFMKGLKKWIRNHNKNSSTTSASKQKLIRIKKRESVSNGRGGNMNTDTNADTNTGTGSTIKKRDSSRKKQKSKQQRSGSKGRDSSNNRSTKSSNSTNGGGGGNGNGNGNIIHNENNDLVQSGLLNIGETNRWSEDEMFKANEVIIGRKIEYDGNPQQFAQKGFNGIDPHAFRIVGGGFMNSGGNVIAEAPDKSKMQPLFRVNDGGGGGGGSRSRSRGGSDDYDDDDDGNSGQGKFSSGGEEEDDDLKPFFSDDGTAPWGEKVMMEDTTTTNATTIQRTTKEKKKKRRSSSSSNNNNNNHHSTTRSSSSISVNSSRSEYSSDTNDVSLSSSIPSASDLEESVLNGKSIGIYDNDDDDDDDDDNGKKTESLPSSASMSTNKNAGLAILTMLREGERKEKDVERVIPASIVSSSQNHTNNDDKDDDYDTLDIFMTDREITAKSQKDKKEILTNSNNTSTSTSISTNKSNSFDINQKKKRNEIKTPKVRAENEDYIYLREWVKSLPESKPTKRFGDFRFNTDAIMVATMKVK